MWKMQLPRMGNVNSRIEVKKMTVVLVILLVVAIIKWLMYRLGLLAVLLYYAECGHELPDQETIRKYQAKVILKTFGIKN